MTAADEQHLIQMAKGGSHEAFRCLVERHMKQAYNVAYGFVNDHYHAEEITQESFLRAHRSLKSFRGDSEFATWLHRIVVNLALNTVKRNKRTASREMTVNADHGISDNGIIPGEQQILAAHIYRALHELPTLQRSVVILRHIDGMSTREVSRVLRCSEGTVKTHLFRGLRKLRDRLRFLKGEVT